MSSSMSALSQLAQSMAQAFECAINFDTWGQRLEAEQQYRKLLDAYENGSSNFSVNVEDERRMQTCLDHVRVRRQHIQVDRTVTPQVDCAVTLQMLKSDLEEFRRVLTKYQAALATRRSSVINITNTKLLKPAPSQSHRLPNMTYVTITVDRLGVKDASDYVNPYLCVRVKGYTYTCDASGVDVCTEQNTPTCSTVNGKYLHFNMNVHVQKPLEQLPQDFAIFFEFMHYKDKKDKVSCRCFAIVERDEIKPGVGTFELYKKPVDYSRKRLYLFTAKPLFLHLQFALEKHQAKSSLVNK